MKHSDIGIMGGEYPSLEVVGGGTERQRRATALLLAHHVERLMPLDKDYGFSMGYAEFHLECEDVEHDAAVSLMYQAVTTVMLDEAEKVAPPAPVFTFCKDCKAWATMGAVSIATSGKEVYFCTRRPPHPTQDGTAPNSGAVVGQAGNLAIPTWPATMAKHGCWDGLPRGK